MHTITKEALPPQNRSLHSDTGPEPGNSAKSAKPESAADTRKHTHSTPYDFSLIIPIFNEVDNLRPLYTEIVTTLKSSHFEIIFANDGSSDGSAQLLDELAHADPRVSVIHFRRNFGQTAALDAGFKSAQGEIIIAMDGDQQNDPADIPQLITKMREGFDVVSGWRRRRQDRALDRKLPSWIANRLIGWATGVRLHDYGCTLKAYRRSMLQHIDLYGEMHRFIPALAQTVGARITEVEVNHRARTRGQTKYGISRVFRVLLDLLTIKFLMRFQTRPLHFIGLPGLVSMAVGSGLLFYLVGLKLIFQESIGHRPLLVISVLLILVGTQFLGLGLLGEYLTRIRFGSQHRAAYLIDRIERHPSFRS